MKAEPTSYAVMAWPDGGFAGMLAAVFETQEEALKDKASRAARFSRWRFRVVEMRLVDA
jgi:hypothetical protein